MLRSKRSRFRSRGTRAFSTGGFAGTVEWDTTYRFAWRRCNPRCHGDSEIVAIGD